MVVFHVGEGRVGILGYLGLIDFFHLQLENLVRPLLAARGPLVAALHVDLGRLVSDLGHDLCCVQRPIKHALLGTVPDHTKLVLEGLLQLMIVFNSLG